jgi:hypothetical protein
VNRDVRRRRSTGSSTEGDDRIFAALDQAKRNTEQRNAQRTGAPLSLEQRLKRQLAQQAQAREINRLKDRRTNRARPQIGERRVPRRLRQDQDAADDRITNLVQDATRRTQQRAQRRRSTAERRATLPRYERPQNQQVDQEGSVQDQFRAQVEAAERQRSRARAEREARERTREIMRVEQTIQKLDRDVKQKQVDIDSYLIHAASLERAAKGNTVAGDLNKRDANLALAKTKRLTADLLATERERLLHDKDRLTQQLDQLRSAA